MNKTAKIVIGVVVGLLVLGVGGSWLYINVIKEDAPEELSLDSDADSTSDATTTTAAGDATATTEAASSADGIDGTWTVTGDSIVGYRAKEVLFGQDTEGVGRTSEVTGSLEIAGTSVESGSFTVDMTSLESDESNRDNQFNGRIMETETYPTATFELTSPIDLGSIPADGTEISASASGKLTLKAETKDVQLDLTAQKDGDTISILTSYTVTFADWGIEDPSFGPAQVEDNALLEVKLVLTKG